MRRSLAFALACAFALAFAGCGSDGGGSESESEAESEAESESESESESEGEDCEGLPSTGGCQYNDGAGNPSQCESFHFGSADDLAAEMEACAPPAGVWVDACPGAALGGCAHETSCSVTVNCVYQTGGEPLEEGCKVAGGTWGGCK